MAAAAAGRAEDEQVVALLEPAVAGDKRDDLGLRDHRHGVEVEGVEGLARRQAGLCEMALDAAAGALGDLVLCERGEEAGGGPDVLDRGQAQVAEQEGEAGGVDGIGRGHAEASSTGAAASAS